MENLFTIIDLETTGLFPSKYDKITEISLKKVSKKGELIDKYTTLVNPERDLGPTSLHKISNLDINNAPTFDEIYNYILWFINETCLIGHNVSFDIKFLNHQLNQQSSEVEILEENTLCTLKFASAKRIPRKLEGIQQLLRGNVDSLHSADNDTEVIREMFSQLSLAKWIDKQDFEFLNLSVSNPGEKIEVNRGEGIKSLNGFFEKLIFESSKKSKDFEDYELNKYAELVERAVEDKVVNSSEINELQEFINDNLISSEDANYVNKELFKNYCAIAYSDFIITEDEKAELKVLGKLLSIKDYDYDEILSTVINEGTKPKETNENFDGMSVCFSGDINVLINNKNYTRKEIEQLAINSGLELKNGVSKKLDLLVVADTQTQSGKARKARDYGIRIISGNDFLNKLDN